jgi:magnesium transporter
MQIPTITYKGYSFLNVRKPDEEIMKYLHERFGFSMLNLEDYLYKTQIPKIETYDEYSLVVMDFPSIEGGKFQSLGSSRNRLSFLPNILTRNLPLPRFTRTFRKKLLHIGEVDFFIGKDYLVVLHDDRTPYIDDLFSLCEENETTRKELMEQGPAYLFYRIADVMVDNTFTVVNDITTNIDYIDKQMQEQHSPQIIEDISVTRRNIVVFQTMIKPALPLFSDLEKGKYKALNGEMAIYWSNILDHLQKIWDRLEDNKELMEGISRSHESLLTIRTNEIVRVLTVFTAIMLPLTLLASIYGMNVALPFSENPHIFTYIILGMIGAAGVMVWIFKVNDWM